MYLSDVVEGGETFFPSLNLTIKPHKGSALLWPNVFFQSDDAMDIRTYHEAKAVISQDTKYAANLWVHLNDYKSPNHWACTG